MGDRAAAVLVGSARGRLPAGPELVPDTLVAALRPEDAGSFGSRSEFTKG